MVSIISIIISVILFLIQRFWPKSSLSERERKAMSRLLGVTEQLASMASEKGIYPESTSREEVLEQAKQARWPSRKVFGEAVKK